MDGCMDGWMETYRGETIGLKTTQLVRISCGDDMVSSVLNKRGKIKKLFKL